MKEIPLTQGLVALVDDNDFEELSKFKWHAKKDRNTYYANRTIGRKTVKMHRVILGLNSRYQQGDHKDGDGLNNQRHNLRVVTRRRNGANRRKHATCSSKFKGVYLDKGKWRARLGLNKKKIELGYFVDETCAAKAYDVAAKQHFGEYACLNFPASL
jgi:hypothetical protein